MNMQVVLNFILILAGAVIMLVSIFKVKELMQSLPYVRERHRMELNRLLVLHRGLMVFFFFGYIFMLGGVSIHLKFYREFVLSLILLFGAIFVLIGILLQARLLAEIQSTLHGILPICAKCKKIRVEHGNYKNPRDWKRIEDYISARAAVDFSHGYCPDCYNEELKSIEKEDAEPAPPDKG